MCGRNGLGAVLFSVQGRNPLQRSQKNKSYKHSLEADKFLSTLPHHTKEFSERRICGSWLIRPPHRMPDLVHPKTHSPPPCMGGITDHPPLSIQRQWTLETNKKHGYNKGLEEVSRRPRQKVRPTQKRCERKKLTRQRRHDATPWRSGYQHHQAPQEVAQRRDDALPTHLGKTTHPQTRRHHVLFSQLHPTGVQHKQWVIIHRAYERCRSFFVPDLRQSNGHFFLVITFITNFCVRITTVGLRANRPGFLRMGLQKHQERNRDFTKKIWQAERTS